LGKGARMFDMVALGEVEAQIKGQDAKVKR